MSVHSTIPTPWGDALPAPRGNAALRYAALEREQDTVELDLRAVWTMLWRNRLLIAAAMTLAAVAGVASILLTPRTYRAEASIQVDAQSAKIMSSDDLEPMVAGSESERFIRTQADILRSRSLAASVAATLGLAQDRNFLPDTAGIDRDETVVDLLLKRVSVEMLPNSRIVQISVDDVDPRRAARIANAFSDKLIKSNLQRRYATSAYSRQFLAGQLSEAKRRLEDAERATIAYARDANLIDASAGATRNTDSGARSLTTANLVQLNDAYAAARSARISAQQRWEQAQRADLMTLPEVLANPTIQQLSQRRAELKIQYQEERQRRKVGHPVVQQLEAKIAEVDRQIGGLAATIRGSIRDQYQVADRQEQALAGDITRLKGETLAEQDRGVRYNILKREADTSRQMYEALLQRYKEISAAAGITNNNITVIDHADTPTRPVSPKAVVNMAVALLAGLAIALLAVFGRERFVDRMRDAEDVRRKLPYPILGVVPRLAAGASPRHALATPRSGFAEAHHSICTSLEFASNSGMPSSILLTSSQPGEGKSTTALSIAQSLAALGKLVVLIDADMRRPSLHGTLKQSNGVGLSHLLTGKKRLEDVVQPTDTPNVYFIGSGPLPPSPSSLLSGNSLRKILDELADNFDVAIIDAPPVLGLADAPRLASICDATVFVLEANGARAQTAQRALQRLDEAHARIAGLVQTKSDASRFADYDYGYAAFERTIEMPAPADAVEPVRKMVPA